MGNLIKPCTIFILFLLCFNSVIGNAQNIEVSITGIRITQGQIIIQVFKDDKGFQDSKPCMIKKFKKTSVVNGVLHVKFNLDIGVYGLALLDDENNNDKMNYNFIGLPKEGFGFSNFELTGFSKPKFHNFSFSVNNSIQKVTMKIRYL